ncbi:NEW3 domain-containing protein, partial [Cognatiluteimonas weifangensis]
SPVIDKAPTISAVTTDFLLQKRPAGPANDIGAYEVQLDGGTTSPTEPAPTCTRAAPTVTLAGDTAAVAAGTTKTYTLTTRNNDSSACSNTTFQTARSVPSGWAGTLSATSFTLAPGASANTTLSVTSPGTATAGSYGIGAGVSSSVGSVHTANASASYTIVAPEEPAPATLTGSAGTDKSSYARGQTVYMSARVLSGSNPVAGAAVVFTTTLPNGSSKLLTATTGQDGYARTSLKLSRGKSAIGSYGLRADATYGTAKATASTTFRVD